MKFSPIVKAPISENRGETEDESRAGTPPHSAASCLEASEDKKEADRSIRGLRRGPRGRAQAVSGPSKPVLQTHTFLHPQRDDQAVHETETCLRDDHQAQGLREHCQSRRCRCHLDFNVISHKSAFDTISDSSRDALLGVGAGRRVRAARGVRRARVDRAVRGAAGGKVLLRAERYISHRVL